MQPTIFFAIPCGWFYEEQRKIIEIVCDKAEIDKAHRIIIEDDSTPAGLWEKICDSIARADFFMADVSSKRPNVLLELGYALKAKELERVAYFISNNATVLEVLSDLSGNIRNQYSSMSDFTAKLIQWLVQSVKVEPSLFDGLQENTIEIKEDFKDLQGFLNRWTTPSGCQFNLTYDGLRFTNAYYPILSANLELLQDYEFSFRAKIEREAVGWVVKGTLNYPNPVPTFCVMFSLTEKGMLRPHILRPGAKLDYFALPEADDIPTGLDLSNRPFSVVTKCVGDNITVIVDEGWSRSFNFATDSRFSGAYNAIKQKHGQVGFRCCGWRPESQSGEVATVWCVRIREITAHVCKVS